jgi:uncharacterized protein (TIGR02996 family)
MTRDEAFLQAVLDSPDDDAPRLIYADWLDENGGPAGAARAAFIRAQCAVERLSWGEDEARRRALKMRIWRLKRRHSLDWDRPLLAALGCDEPGKSWFARLARRFRPVLPNRRLQFRTYFRGFVGAVGIGMGVFLECADALFRVAPVQRVTFQSAAPERLPTLLSSPHLARLRGLELSALEMDDADARRLAESPHVAGLRALNLQANQIGPMGVGALADSPSLAELTDLRLGMNPVGDAGAFQLAESPHLSRLTWLEVSDCEITSAGLDVLRKRFPTAHITV